jgi:hypothetical protein
MGLVDARLPLNHIDGRQSSTPSTMAEEQEALISTPTAIVEIKIEDSETYQLYLGELRAIQDKDCLNDIRCVLRGNKYDGLQKVAPPSSSSDYPTEKFPETRVTTQRCSSAGACSIHLAW